MTAEIISAELVPKMKQYGFKKRGLTWYKKKEHITVLFGIQKSQFSSDIWYYNFGIGINTLYEQEINTILRCDITFRLDQQIKGVVLSSTQIFDIVKMWDDKFGNLEKLRRCALAGDLPLQTSKKAITFLTSSNM